jgi:hypothetical protein
MPPATLTGRFWPALPQELDGSRAAASKGTGNFAECLRNPRRGRKILKHSAYLLQRKSRLNAFAIPTHRSPPLQAERRIKEPFLSQNDSTFPGPGARRAGRWSRVVGGCEQLRELRKTVEGRSMLRGMGYQVFPPNQHTPQSPSSALVKEVGRLFSSGRSGF